MNRILFLLLGMTFFLPAFSEDNQAFEPKDTWPFVYESFTDGSIYSSTGETLLNAKMNVSVLNQKLYYLKGETIMEADMVRLYAAKIGPAQDVYVNVGAKMYRVLAESDGGAALQADILDAERYNKASIGYGVTSYTASTQNVSGLAMESSAGVNINTAMASREGGEPLPILQKKYILYGQGRMVPALKREVMDIPDLDKQAAKEFFKENKIKWNQAASLTQVADFLTNNLKHE
jgi:hypothetical protein